LPTSVSAIGPVDVDQLALLAQHVEELAKILIGHAYLHMVIRPGLARLCQSAGQRLGMRCSLRAKANFGRPTHAFRAGAYHGHRQHRCCIGAIRDGACELA
jgi:hypothetical protein